jgi:Domain of unknown function (DUF4263)
VDEDNAVAAAEGFSPEYVERDTEFDVENGDFSALAIRDAGKPSGFHYFYDTESRRLITDFVLDDRPQVATMCQVTLIRKDDKYSPRIRLWKKDKTGPGRGQARLEITDLPETRAIKAMVDTDECHDNFWKLIAYLQSLSEIDLPANTFRVLAENDTAVVEMLQRAPRAERLAVIRAAVGNLTEDDIQVLAGRKAELDRFERLLNDDDFFEAEQARVGRGPEAVWQEFFERNTWIFGYGLNLISCESLTDAKLEQITTGASVFAGGGKRSDALLRTRGYVSSLLFGEIKTHRTPLLKPAAYRPPDVYQPSEDVVGGVAQVQKTTQKAIQAITDSVHALRNPDGTPTGVEVSTIRPRQVLITGNLREFAVGDDINVERSSSFELYRRSISDVEIITFDELFERAVYIVRDAG